jgi:hypothetical protein
MNSTDLSQITAILLSLASSYIPGYADWFAALSGTYKRLVMLLLLVAATGSIFGLACAGIISVPCDNQNAFELLKALGLAIIANQTTYLLSPRPARLNRPQSVQSAPRIR